MLYQFLKKNLKNLKKKLKFEFSTIFICPSKFYSLPKQKMPLFLFHQFKFIPHKHYQNKNTRNSTFRRTKINSNKFFNIFSEMSQLLKLAKCHKKLVPKRAGSSNWEYHPEYRAGLWKKIVKTEIYYDAS